MPPLAAIEVAFEKTRIRCLHRPDMPDGRWFQLLKNENAENADE
jgi:hypothetical protein